MGLTPSQRSCELSPSAEQSGKENGANTMIHQLRGLCELQYSTVQYSTVQYGTVRYSTVQYSEVQYSSVQYSTVQ